MRRTAVIGKKKLSRYNTDIAALSETPFPENSPLEEHRSGYTFFWSDRLAHEPRQSGVDFAIRNHRLKLLDKLPKTINERLATMTMKGNSHVTFISAYAPTMAYSDKAKEEFYEQLHHAIQSVSHTDNLFLLGDFKARVRSDHTTLYKVLGHHGIRKENSNGTLLLTLCAGRQLVITNAQFTENYSFKTTWRQPRSGHWHQIYFVIIRQKDLPCSSDMLFWKAKCPSLSNWKGSTSECNEPKS